jgi:hypothetical protein
VALAAWCDSPIGSPNEGARGMLTRAAGARVLVGLPLIAARIWWSVAAAIAVFAVTLTMYVAAAVRYMHRHPGHS